LRNFGVQLLLFFVTVTFQLLRTLWFLKLRELVARLTFRFLRFFEIVLGSLQLGICLVQTRIDYVFFFSCGLQIPARLVERRLQLGDFIAQVLCGDFDWGIPRALIRCLPRCGRQGFRTRLRPGVTLRRDGRNIRQRTCARVEVRLPCDSLLKSQDRLAYFTPAIFHNRWLPLSM
jgi:hypothetical protein